MNKKILIIEDDDSFRDNLGHLLTLSGYHTETAANGAEGLLKIAGFLPDLIICDVDMPGMTGFQVLQQLRRHNVYNNTAFVFLSAHIPSGDDETKMVALANDYMIKPISFVSLEKRIKNILS